VLEDWVHAVHYTARYGGENVRLIDADALFAVVKGHHDLYNGATNPTDKARRDENLQVMCDITDAPDIDAIPVEWLRNEMNMADDRGDGEMTDAISWLLQTWQQEREAR